MKLKYFILFVLVQLKILTKIVLASSVVTVMKPTPKILSKLLPPQDCLSFTHYHSTCPDLESIIHSKVQAWFNKVYTLAASLIRLHFHDCVVSGCDAPILLNHRGSERTAKVSKTLRGYRVIDEIKAEVQKKCPITVACADILTAAARGSS